jgi:hypothetical protein
LESSIIIEDDKEKPLQHAEPTIDLPGRSKPHNFNFLEKQQQLKSEFGGNRVELQEIKV